ncbi:(S)-ureidoglycine aminohydrolase [Acuticoccus kandeliae]|uniref:(S)-ureidoglycine aminohydrolase n=1 Tax=Acuticoccus kandeliae TaxID=2073160 RepID=UPI000D3ED5E4|nr:(S)-ureidoglycine aminohydrolase [Acuticoccus kandeliae]
MSQPTYFAPSGTLPPQSATITSRAILTDTYAIIPASSLTDNVAAPLPGWDGMRCWVLAAPAIAPGTAFAQYLVHLDPDGGSDRPEADISVESFLFLLDGALTLTLDGADHRLAPGGYAFAPAGASWSVRAGDGAAAKFIWVRKAFEPLGPLRPSPIVANEQALARSNNPMTDRQGAKHLIPTTDPAYDMHMNIVCFDPGATIPAIEMHIMEHGLYMLEGQGMYLLNERWHEVRAGDFIWMRAFCPQAYYAGGPGPTRYLLYKNMNRQVSLPRAPGGVAT